MQAGTPQRANATTTPNHSNANDAQAAENGPSGESLTKSRDLLG